MSSINQATVLGRLGKDPELRYLPDGTAACNLSIATSESWKDKATGEKVEHTEWHSIALFGRRAEVADEYLKKGDLAYFQGRMKKRKYTDRDGIERYSFEIQADDMKLMPKGERREGEGTSEPRTPPTTTRMQQAQPRNSYADARGRPQPAPAPKPSTSFDDMDDDIPF